jgi:hypothetical protein
VERLEGELLGLNFKLRLQVTADLGARQETVEFGDEKVSNGFSWVKDEDAVLQRTFQMSDTLLRSESMTPDVRKDRLKSWPVSSETRA